MKKQKYNTLEEWKVDLRKFYKNPNDKILMQDIALKVEKSDTKIQLEIRDYLESIQLVKNPMELLELMSIEFPTCSVIIKSKDDPWFHV